MNLITDINQMKNNLNHSKSNDYLKANSMLTSFVTSYAISCNGNLSTIFTNVLKKNGVGYWLSLLDNSHKYSKKENDYINNANYDFYNVNHPLKPIVPKQVNKILNDFSTNIQKTARAQKN